MRSLASRLRYTLPGRVVFAYFESQTPNYAAGLAFNAFLTMFPIILGLVAILGLFLRDTDFYAQVEHVLVGIFPINAQDTRDIEATLTAATQNAGTIGLVSLLVLLWSGTGLFASLEFALNHIYGVAGRNPIQQRVTGLRLIAVFVIAIVLAVVLNSLIGLIDANLTPLNVVAGWLVLTYLLAWIYRFVPNLRLTLREVMPGAIAAGALIEVLTLAFPVFYKLTHEASVYTKGFAIFFFLATWLYLLSQLLLMGAILNRLLRPVTPRSAGDVPGLEDAAAIALAQEAKGRGVQA